MHNAQLSLKKYESEKKELEQKIIENTNKKTDINNDLIPALEKSNIKNHYITKHLGTDQKMIDLIIERAKEVEHAN